MASKLIADVSKNGTDFLSSHDDEARQKTIAAAYALIQELENPGEQMARIGWGEPTRTAALQVAFELGLLKKLAADPQSSWQLANGTGAETELVARTLKHLAANGIIKEVGEDQYVGTPFSMATNDPTIAGGLVYSFEAMIPTFMNLSQFLAKTNYKVPMDDNDSPVKYALKIDSNFFAYLRENQKVGTAFNDFMTGYAMARPRWFDFYPVEERLGKSQQQGKGPLLVDVGGGVGHELAGLHAKHPNLPGQLVLQDQPSVIAEAVQKGELPRAIHAVPHDFFTPQPDEFRGATAYYMRLILHDWPDNKCITILSHLHNAMVPGHSKLLINETVLKDVGASWQQTSLDWTMMGMLVNRERTEVQWTALLAKAGLKITGIWTKGNESVIEAVRET